MKKIMAIILAVSMIFGTFTTVAYANDGEVIAAANAATGFADVLQVRANYNL